MIDNPAIKYHPHPVVNIADRQWPNKTITQAPIWMTTDLRDGNQALIEPMDIEKKLRLFELLVKIGFKQIEVAFPAASETDFNFVRKLIEEERVPDDVTIEVLTQSREHLIRRTVESLVGVKKAIVHIYNPISPTFRRVVFQKSPSEVIDIAVNGTRLLKSLVKQYPATQWSYEYSPETFSMAELTYAKEICDAVSEAWEASPENKIILNLPATVEAGTPNLFADQIEWMHNHLERRDSIILSVHPHNDRGSAVAAAELALMAGAERVEGCLFGNGERTGNVDLITLGLNLYTQGIDPNLNFSDMDEIQKCMEYCTQISVHPRHPYCGELVFTAFSGSHQDAIKKGMAQPQSNGVWEVPYLPIDPKDLGRNYGAIIRLNSQSGKGGIAYVMEQVHGIKMPRKMQIELSQVVQSYSDRNGGEILSNQVYEIFVQEYIDQVGPYHYVSHKILNQNSNQREVHFELILTQEDQNKTLHGLGNGPLDAVISAINSKLEIFKFFEYSIGSGAEAEAICFIEFRYDSKQMLFGAGRDTDILTASLKAIISGLNRFNQLYQVQII